MPQWGKHREVLECGKGLLDKRFCSENHFAIDCGRVDRLANAITRLRSNGESRRRSWSSVAVAEAEAVAADWGS